MLYATVLLVAVACQREEPAPVHYDLPPIPQKALETKFGDEVWRLSEGKDMTYTCDGGIDDPQIGVTQMCTAYAPDVGSIHRVVRITSLNESGEFSIALELPPDYTPRSVPPLPTDEFSGP